MKAFFALGLLILIAFLGSRFLFKRRKLLDPVSYFVLSGLIYIFLGFILGKHGFNVLSAQVLKGFNPLISFGLGWIGFLFGFQLEFRYLRRFSKKYVFLSFLQFFLVFCLVGVSLILVLKWLFSSEPSVLLSSMAVGLALLCTLNSPSLLNLASSMIPQKGDYYYLARFLVSVSGFWGICGLALVSSFWHFPFQGQNGWREGLIFVLSLTVFSLLVGYLFHLLTIKKTADQDLFVFLLSLVFFASGTAFYFNLPPLCICMIMGMTFSNLTKVQEKVYPLLFSTEKPFYILFLILIGALWELRFDYKIGLLVGLLLVLRLIGFSTPLRPLGGILRFPFPLPSLFGFCFLSPGGLSVAFAVSIKLIYPQPFTDTVVSVGLLLIIISELLSPWALQKSLSKLGSKE